MPGKDCGVLGGCGLGEACDYVTHSDYWKRKKMKAAGDHLAEKTWGLGGGGTLQHTCTTLVWVAIRLSQLLSLIAWLWGNFSKVYIWSSELGQSGSAILHCAITVFSPGPFMNKSFDLKGALKRKSNLPAYFLNSWPVFKTLTTKCHREEVVWRVHNDRSITTQTKRRLRIGLYVAVTGMVSVQELGEGRMPTASSISHAGLALFSCLVLANFFTAQHVILHYASAPCGRASICVT